MCCRALRVKARRLRGLVLPKDGAAIPSSSFLDPVSQLAGVFSLGQPFLSHSPLSATSPPNPIILKGSNLHLSTANGAPHIRTNGPIHLMFTCPCPLHLILEFLSLRR